VVPDQQPIGPEVSTRMAQVPTGVILEGRFIRLEPLNPDLHADALFQATSGADNIPLWQYLFDGPFEDRLVFHDYIAKKASSRDPRFYALICKQTGTAVGHAAYMRIEPAHRVLEVGSILFSRGLQKTPAATECMYLMARHAFETLGYRRYEWKCNALNEGSRRAAIRLGFQFEGVFRQHMIIKGRNRDTAWYSMLDKDWPLCKRAFERWLHPSNFNSDGRQILSLSSFRTYPQG
jgi:RimJ/RimL family protein N-acetyltransferase